MLNNSLNKCYLPLCANASGFPHFQKVPGDYKKGATLFPCQLAAVLLNAICQKISYNRQTLIMMITLHNRTRASDSWCTKPEASSLYPLDHADSTNTTNTACCEVLIQSRQHSIMEYMATVNLGLFFFLIQSASPTLILSKGRRKASGFGSILIQSISSRDS
jgi:hypothetical protein